MFTFLGESGITSTSANYLANLAKEVAKKDESYLKNLQFYKKEVELVNGNKKVLSKGKSSVTEMSSVLKRLANFNTFCAWMREGIKEHEAALDHISRLSDSEFSQISGIPEPTYPQDRETVTSDDILDTYSVKQRLQYLRLEAFASTFGKYIHPDGAISNARDLALNYAENPVDIDGEGRDLLIYTYTPSVEISRLDEAFLKLQKEYRQYESQLNSMKSQLKKAANSETVENTQEYVKDAARYNIERDNFLAAKKQYILEQRERIAALKIIIPNELQDTYEYLSHLND